VGGGVGAGVVVTGAEAAAWVSIGTTLAHVEEAAMR
jgi:hypothetical protein